MYHSDISVTAILPSKHTSTSVPAPDLAIRTLPHNKSILPPPGKPLAAAESKAGKTQFPVPHFPALNAATHIPETPRLWFPVEQIRQHPRGPTSSDIPVYFQRSFIRWEIAIPGIPCIAASRTAATVPEIYTSTPKLPPALIPESTKSGFGQT